MAIEEADILAGRYDGGAGRDLCRQLAGSARRALSSSTFTRSRGETRRAGLFGRARGLASRLDRLRGRLYRRRCDAVLGDVRCGVDLSDPRYVRTAVFSRKAGGAFVVSGADDIDPTLFSGGHLVWTSGTADGGLSADIAGCIPPAAADPRRDDRRASRRSRGGR